MIESHKISVLLLFFRKLIFMDMSMIKKCIFASSKKITIFPSCD